MNEVLRQENKYLLNSIDHMRINNKLKSFLQEDSNNGIDGYKVRSLYFDTINEDDYEEKDAGIELRRKIRLRIYNPSDDTAKLEITHEKGVYSIIGSRCYFSEKENV